MRNEADRPVTAIHSGGDETTELLATKGGELEDPRRHLGQIAGYLAGVSPEPTAGVVRQSSSSFPAVEQLRTAITLAELRRRLPGVQISACAFSDEAALLFDGEPVLPIGRSNHLAIDCAVLIGPADAEIGSALESLPVPACRLGDEVTGDGSSVLALIGRLLDHDFVSQRGTFLRSTRAVPLSSGFALACFGAQMGGEPDPGELNAVARITKLELVMAPDESVPTDLVAMVGVADLVITDLLPVAALAAGLSRSVMVVSDDPDHLKWCEETGIAAGRSGDLIALATDVGARDVVTIRDRMVRSADLTVDALAGSLLNAMAGTLARSFEGRLANLAERVHVLESVNEGLRRTLLRDRALMTKQLRDLAPEDVAIAAHAQHSRDWMQLHPRTAAEAEIHIAQLRREIDLMYSTRLFRYSKPVRRLYGRVRSALR